MGVNQHGSQKYRQNAVLQAEWRLAQRGEQALHRLAPRLRFGKECLQRFSQFPHRRIGLGVRRMEPEFATMLSVQTCALKQRFVHAAFGRVPLEAQRVLSRVVEHRLDEVAAGGGGRRRKQPTVNEFVPPVRGERIHHIAGFREQVV